MLRSYSIRRIMKYSQYNFSTINSSTAEVRSSNEDRTIEKSESSDNDMKKLVAAAFASLRAISNTSLEKSTELDEINSAKDLDELLSFVTRPYLSKQSALKILTLLTNWANEGKIRLSDFEADMRFAKLCRLLGRGKSGSHNADMADLSVVLGVTADEQAAKLINSISLSQMIKILKSLGLKKRRSTPLLRSLAFHIANSTEKLNIKEVSDAFYSFAELNYPDEILLQKIRDDLCECLPSNANPAVVFSIIKSLGLLRYRDTELLEMLCEWILKHHRQLKSKDFLSLLFTLANVNYVPECFPQFHQVLKPHMNETSMVDLDKWVLAVWCSVVLYHYDENIIDSVMHPDFISKLAASRKIETGIDQVTKMRLLQINGVAKQMGNTYKGHLLDEKSEIYRVSLTERKEKQFMIDSIRDTISTVVGKPNEFLEMNINSEMGFLIDIICYVDNKSNFVKISPNLSGENVKKIALMVCDFHDYCRAGSGELTGSSALKHRLLSGIGYSVLPISYTDYSPKNAVVNRVRYIHEKIKTLFKF